MEYPQKETVYIGLGSNIEPRLEYLYEAIARINQIKGCCLLAISSVYESAAMGFDGPPFFNMCITVECMLSPIELLEYCQSIEKQLGREQKKTRNNIYQSRPIDIDLLEFGNKIIAENNLLLPHPEINNRPFVKIPLEEIKKQSLFSLAFLEETVHFRTSDSSLRFNLKASTELKRLLNLTFGQ